MIIINGEERQAAGVSLQDYLLAEGYDLKRVVVEVNLDIIPREELGNHIIQEGDSIEVLRFVGGG